MSLLHRTVGKTTRERASQIAPARVISPGKARYSLRVRQRHRLLSNLGGTTWKSPAPQGAGLFVYSNQGGDQND